ncbi:tetraacyldisaccharide 4'-kinase [Leptospira ilyithenensis]|uniref:Tetraacyldisaccharide 4'-kinase n=1 Tax=Leptospira ilyithenensis TaxID=2484901 RepID=A0A4V3JX86_9LEPT|nr:tetraacyldisaccharide 4'-kinase [Leptospira ilyithenensis]TGN10351.1 tetraacyldisaccharide 4'-kinase [Leptospira ilyithenensis]
MWIFSPLSLLYQFLFYLDRSRTESLKLGEVLVVSVGNLTVGGTGKTPFVQYLIGYIQKHHKDYAITILSRGYGATLSKQGAKVELHSIPGEVGDEPKLHKESFPDVQVIIGRDRFGSFQKHNSVLGKKHIVILDDGFQHHKIQRDLDIVLMDANRPLGNGWTIPLGTLRERDTSLKRADLLLFTKITDETANLVKKLGDTYSKKFPRLSVFYSRFLGSLIFGSNLKKKYRLVTGVGNPQFVLKTAKECLKTKDIELHVFPDHHHYKEDELLSILSELPKNTGLVTTEKDWVKWKEFPKFLSELENLKIYPVLIGLEIRIEGTDAFNLRLESLVSNYESKTFPV